MLLIAAPFVPKRFAKIDTFLELTMHFLLFFRKKLHFVLIYIDFQAFNNKQFFRYSSLQTTKNTPKDDKALPKQQKKEPVFRPALGIKSILIGSTRLFCGFALVFLQLLLQGVDAAVDRLFEGLALLAGIKVVASQNQADVGNLVLRGVGVVEFQRNFGVDHLAVLGTELFHFLSNEVFKFLVSLEVN